MRSILAFTCVLAACGGPSDFEFANLRVDQLEATRAVIRFDTTEPTSCEAEYGTSEDAMDLRATDPDMAPGQRVVDHRLPLEDLLPDTTYFVLARATTKNGITKRSDILVLRTLPSDDPTAGMTNVALKSAGTTVVPSSNWDQGDNDSWYGAHRAIDGQMGTEWSTNYDGDDAFLEIDLGQVRTLSHFGYRSREMSDGTSIVTSVQLVLEDGRVLGPYHTPDPSVRYVFSFDAPVETRRLRFEAVTTTGGNTGAREIELFSAE